MASLSLPTTPVFHSTIKSTKTKLAPQFSTTHLSKPHENPQPFQISNKCFFHQISSLCKDGLLKEAFALCTKMELEANQIGPEIYGELLQGCVYERALSQGQQIHARLLKCGSFFHKNEYLETKLVIFYAKCDLLDVSANLFARQSRPNVFSWAAMIGLYCRQGFNLMALTSFCEMMKDGFLPDNFVVPNALKACSALQLVGFGQGVHGYVFKMGFGNCVFVLSSLVDFYGKCAFLEDARNLFEEMPERNVVAWNSLLVGYAQNGLNEVAIKVFYDMRVEGIQPTRVTVASFLSASAKLEYSDVGRQGHAVAILSGLELDNILGSSIINFYSKIGWFEDAELAFHRMLERDIVTWNLLLSGYLQNKHLEKAINTCCQMREENMRFDSVTLTSILTASSDCGFVKLGRAAHGYCIRNNLDAELVVASNILDFYAKSNRMDHARQVFDLTMQRDLVLWNTLISGYAHCGMSGEALKMFYQMQLDGFPPTVVSWNSVIFGFVRNGQVNEAHDLFMQMQSTGVQPNVVTWTTLISSFAKNGYGNEAVMLFTQMQAEGIEPSAASNVGVLLACTNLTSLQYGKAVHGHSIRRQLLTSQSLVTVLVDMYAKCGSINLAKKTFEMVPNKELALHNTMIAGFALNGQAKEALALYEQMQTVGMEPDDITFTALLSACSHGGYVNDGLKVFNDMVSTYKLHPCLEHLGCLVTMLARDGNFSKALRIISEMPFEPDSHMLASLLAACKDHNEIELSEYISETLFKLEPENLANYVTLSNTYAAAGKWDDALRTREIMRRKGLRKNPGCSWIRIGSEVHTFVAGDRSHPQAEVVHETLLLLEREMKLVGYAPASNLINQNSINSQINTSFWEIVV